MKYDITCKYTYNGKPCAIKARVNISYNEYELVEMKSKNAYDVVPYDERFGILAEINGQIHELECTFNDEDNCVAFSQVIIWAGADNDCIEDTIDAFHVAFSSKPKF